MAFSMVLTFIICSSYERKKVLGQVTEVSSGVKESLSVIVIDAGHGGKDGGCSAYDSTLEKDYNLSNAKRLQLFFDMSGYKTVMTRDTDEDTDLLPGEFDKKKDIKNRIKKAEEQDKAIFLSIHANLSTSVKDQGFITFYSHINPDSQLLAEEITKAVSSTKICTRIRDVKKSPSSVYLQKHIKTPSVLIECGFLSNPQDLSLLKTDKFSEQLMFSIFSGTVNSGL